MVDNFMPKTKKIALSMLWAPKEARNKILSIWNKMESLYFMVQIKYHKLNSVQTITSFKILNDKAVYISLDLWNKIWIMKWTNEEIFKRKRSLSRKQLIVIS